MTHLVAGNLVQWPRPSVASHVVLLIHPHRCVVHGPLAWTGVGQLDERERRAANGGHRLWRETHTKKSLLDLTRHYAL